MATIKAKYNGTCRACGAFLPAGSRIDWSRDTGSRCAGGCQEKTAGDGNVDAPYSLEGGSGYGCDGWAVGQLMSAYLLDGKLSRKDVEGAQRTWLVVVRASRRYIREDGMSFGLGDESGYLYSASCRLATEEEYAPALEAEAKAAARAEALKTVLRLEGEYPEGSHVLVGEEVPLEGADRRIYGGGNWAVIEPAGERVAPPAEDLAAAKAEFEGRKAALETASASLVAWTEEHLPADAPHRRLNGGRAPYDGRLYGKDLACLGADQRVEYERLESEVRRLSYTSSPDSYHVAEARLRDLEQQAWLASYPRSIWIVRNNGHDGDDWSRNNVDTGGAGAIGVRLPWSSETEDMIRAARAEE